MAVSYADAKIEVERLVERFARNLDVYKRGDYKEAQVRVEFIDPFFEALGWDVRNVQGYAEQYKDVIHEDAIKVSGATRAPDYCFRIGGVRKFFLEAKKPSVSVKGDVGPAYQLRRYAWSAKLPLSILTDFEEFAVYDCRQRPKPNDGASMGRIMYLTFDQYLDHFDDIYGVFAKEAVLQGSFDRYVQDAKRKRGTSEVDAEFLKEIEVWREVFARNIALRNPDLSVHELNFAVQRTIDRIIFLRMCEDRGIEDYGQLLALTTPTPTLPQVGGGGIYARLGELYRQADEKYNSDLFDFRADTLTKTLTVDDRVLKPILAGLYYPQSPYEFSVLPAEVLGQVYEQFLGKVIRLTPSHQAKVEEKPEVKKAGGVYYTPAHIVDYIVQQTVGQLIEGKTPRQISKLRILDPACGSGSFLLGAYQYLLDYHRQWYEAHDPAKHAQVRQPALYQAPTPSPSPERRGGGWRLTTAEKKRILLNNIHGVDIDRQAVEVTKLSLLLKVLEGENQETLGQQLALWRERALPDLGDNIKCGNSLIGPDYFEAQLLPDEDEMRRVNPFDWEAEFPEIMATGGFDAVIGNPPYGAEFPPSTTNCLKNNFVTFVGRGESYLLFVEKAIAILKLGGLFGYIIPDTYLNLGFTQPLREFLLQNTNLREVALLPAKVFPGTTVDTTMLFTEKARTVATFNESDVLVKVFDKKLAIKSIAQPSREFSVSTALWHEQQTFNVQSDSAELSLVARIEKQNPALSQLAEMFSGIKAYEVGKGTPPQTKRIRETKPFTSATRKDESWSAFYDGKHVARYELLWKRNNWVKYGTWLAAPRNPKNFEGEKLLIRKIVGETLIATYVPDISYCNTLLFILKIKPGVSVGYHYLLGILNSHFMGWCFRKKFQISSDDTFPQIMIRDILQFPIPMPAKAHHDRMVTLVERMLALHQKLAAATIPADKQLYQRQIEATDRQIDVSSVST